MLLFRCTFVWVSTPDLEPQSKKSHIQRSGMGKVKSEEWKDDRTHTSYRLQIGSVT